MPDNLSFSIMSVESIHLAFRDSASYWESYRAGEGDRLTERFEFKQGWQPVYARYIETPHVKVTLSDGTVGWGEAYAGIGPEVTCLIVNEHLAPMIEGRGCQNQSVRWSFLLDKYRWPGDPAG